ncbi:MAG TPA: nucleotidyltransferase domain-containing protein [Candidatus Nanoarchaeia archaeon]|nr:nucleotidyltransferase domain-containing protein [Candidatus Nanoarchaeia archaeon]
MDEKRPKNLVEKGNTSDKKYEEHPKAQSLTPEQQAKQVAEFEKMKSKLEAFKKAVVKKYPFTMAMGLLPMNAFRLLEEDEGLPKEVVDSKPLHVIMLIPEDNYKELSKIKPEVVKMAKETKENLWVHIKTPVDVWNYGLDSKFEFIDAISASLPIHDNGFLGALRVANIHKSLLLRKFEKYVTSYVIAGSLVRGTAGKDSDVDVFVVIDDTDVKRMSRVELLDKLKGIVYDYIKEATALAGVKNILSPQVWLLTDFWQSVRDVNPVIFTFIRDGIPLYDRGTFLPWKLLLKMGKIKPSPEAIEIYMKESERTEEMVKRRMIDAMIDIYYGIVTPTQAMMMLYGMAPPTHKESPKVFKEIFFDKEKMVDKKYVGILEKIVNNFRQYEYGKLKEISGAEIDRLRKDGQDYNKMLQKLREKIEKKLHEKTAKEVYAEVFKMLANIFGKKPDKVLLNEFKDKLVKKGKIEQRFLKSIDEISSVERKAKSGKLNLKDVDSLKKDAVELIKALVEYAQRADLICENKGTIMQIVYSGNRKAELVLTGKDCFLIEGKEIRKIHGEKLELVKSSKEELEKALAESKGKLSTKISGEVFHTLEKALGKFEIVI